MKKLIAAFSIRAGTPTAVVDRLHAEVEAIIASADAQKQMIEMGLVPAAAMAPSRLTRFLESEIEYWGKIVHQAGAAGIE